MSNYEDGYNSKYGYNRNAFAHGTVGTAAMGRIVKLIATPIGFVSEAFHARNDKPRPSAATANSEAKNPTKSEHGADTEGQRKYPDSAYIHVPDQVAQELVASGQAEATGASTPTHELIPEEDNVRSDEADWALDEAAAKYEHQPNTILPAVFTEKDPQKANVAPRKDDTEQTLPFPVVIPQRRPGTKSRGFVRAYAPVLDMKGLSQDTFLSFLKEFHTAAQASPIFNVVMIATAIAGAYPDPLVALAIQAVQVAAGVGQEIQERFRTNKFLAQANKDIFMPRGLYAMVVMHTHHRGNQPEVGLERVDLAATAVVKYEAGSPSRANLEETGNSGPLKGVDAQLKHFRVSSGKTREAEMPVTCAPLIFPAFDRAIGEEGNGAAGDTFNVVKAKTRSSSKFVNDYFDRRAQATYAFKNPTSTLTTQVAPSPPTFKSRFADPNNATNKHFFTLITGGKWKAEPLGARRRYEHAQRRAAEDRARGVRQESRKRLLRENVLYLMVVNLPAEEELARAREHLKEKNSGRRGA